MRDQQNRDQKPRRVEGPEMGVSVRRDVCELRRGKAHAAVRVEMTPAVAATDS